MLLVSGVPFLAGQSLKTSAPRRVVITGSGIITSMGNGWRANADGFREGRLAFREITLFDTTGQRVHSGGQLELPAGYEKLDRASAMLLCAAREAWGESGWEADAEEAMPICLGTSAGAMAVGEDYYKQAVDEPGNVNGQRARIRAYLTESQALTMADGLGISGPVTIITNACASGANAIGHAYRQVQSGRAERAIAGGYDALCKMVFSGFDSLQALTTSLPPRPFDANRDGLALGEGAAVVTVETLESAKKRGANILAEIVGYGAATDLHHLTQPNPEGDAALASMNAACTEAGMSHADIDYINSHGTGTPLNDIAEGNAICRWAGNDVGRVAVSSTKASVGHLLGGAGAVEAVISLMAMKESWLPPTTTVKTPDPVCKFDLVREPRDAELRAVLTNSFGFGGANATLVMKKLS